MIKKTKTLIAGLTTLVGLTAASSLAGDSKNGISCEVNPVCSTRYRVEQTENAETDSRLTKTTFGWANCELGSGGESFRVYNYEGSGEGNDYTAVGAKLPKLTLAGIETSTLAFGTFGDQEGIGIETKTSFESGTTLFANFEKNQTTDSTRKGIGVDQKIGNVTLKAGYDRVSTPAGNTDYSVVGAVWNINSNDQVGVGFRRANSDTGNTDTGLAYWCHHGKDESWGHRTRVRVDSPENGSETYSGEIVLAQNPTFSKFSSPWMVDRGVDAGGMFNTSVVENALSAERTPLADRSRRGFVATVNGAYNPESEAGNIFAEAGYKFNLTENASLTLTANARRNIQSDDNTLGGAAHFTWQTKAGNFYAEISGDDEGRAYGSIGYSCNLPNVFGRD